MIPFPQQSVQQKHEYDSLSILGYVLKDLGIMSSVAVNDFGIDLEFDLVEESLVTGRIFKAQVKSSHDLGKDANGHVTIGNIKQSTLSYWMRISLYCPVVVFAVDVKTEEIYYSEPIHLQAASLIDGTESRKTVRLAHCLSKGLKPQESYVAFLEAVASKKNISDDIQVKISDVLCSLKSRLDAQKSRRELMISYLGEIAITGNLSEQKILHVDCLRQLEHIVDLKNEWVNRHMDYGTEIFEPDTFRLFLKATRQFVGYWPISDYCKKNGLDIARVYSDCYWEDRSNEILKPLHWRVGITFEGIRDHIPYFVDLLLKYLAARRSAILGSEAHYWRYEDLHYLQTVFETPIPKPHGATHMHIFSFHAFVQDVVGKTNVRIAQSIHLKKQRAKAKAVKKKINNKSKPKRT